MPDDAINRALQRALVLARRGPQRGGNPRVGCVIIGSSGAVLAEGWHHGAGTEHAEAAAMAAADRSTLRGATAVITLEPCHHSGRTAPCSQALLSAGIARVVYAVRDPDPVAAGGAQWLRSQGLEVRTAREAEVPDDVVRGAEALTEAWVTAVERRTPWVLGKMAASLDGRVAAVDGTSKWITGPVARDHAHAVRGDVDAIVVGTGTVIADDPALTARRAGGTLADHQPLRVAVGHRSVPASAAIRNGPGDWLHLTTRDIPSVLARLWDVGARRVLIEGGPTLLGAAVRAGVVDELHSYVAPVLLGAGPAAVPDLGVSTLADAHRRHTTDAQHLGEDILVVTRRA
ncbi:bifunctional diaminohydroxyphosphoribosylaminopyrimidine deaminase/5-amino-6-(5-phosphoribosylamino)uracil reductase RibD [Pseudactinotalea sp. Z1732]|uniref:bifunctional diaminohydroxyphosphoribosylaminopyrimidine deaminase/5-amino-6-(5-phosphoribosylamino)uracil reductase RibD n=1 Tax=Pseudactinotalea sp. Z1732 TaxID=3413026 RepID=UPI003C7A9EB7